MPLREYQCEACGHRFEVIQRMSDPPIEKCPVCGGTVHKLQAAPAFHLKGTGWYVTDYGKKDSGTKAAEGESTTAAKPADDKSAKPADTTSSTASTPATTPTTTPKT